MSNKKKKYLVVSGNVRSKHDGDKHFVGYWDLVRLYGVDPREAIPAKNVMVRGLRGKYLVLKPRYQGDYELENCKIIDLDNPITRNDFIRSLDV